MTDTRWIELDGAVNVRDLGGLPTLDGGSVAPGRLIRSGSLQRLTDADVRHLVDDLGVRSVADLRTGVELRGEGPGPMVGEAEVELRHLSLFPEPDDVAVDDAGDGPVVLPWQTRDANLTDDERRRGASAVYLHYLQDRPDSILGALRLIAGTDGATVVHCAAGKDRTGVVVAIALSEVGVSRAAVVADYARTAERIGDILDHLNSRDTYRGEGDLVSREAVAKHTPRAETMTALLAEIDERFGGVPAWLRSHGWTDDDAAALARSLLAR